MPNVLSKDADLQQFMRDVSLASLEPDVALPNFRRPSVAAQIDPNRSFWRDHVTYPFPVKFAQGRDGRGRTWQIGYMDEYAGTAANPPILVIIHGKGAFGGHYGNVMTHALRRGMRVIVPDLPSYNMSGPGNLELDESRSMQDMREAIHDVIVNRLGVARAHYMGHSLGGQFVMGYGLSWPDAVQSMILYAPSGLEEFPREIDIGGGRKIALFDPALANQGRRWREVWEPAGLLAGRRRHRGCRSSAAGHATRRGRDRAGRVAAGPWVPGVGRRASHRRLHRRQSGQQGLDRTRSTDVPVRPARGRHRLARLRRQRPAAPRRELLQLHDGPACGRHAGRAGCAGHRLLPPRHPQHRRHHRHPHAAGGTRPLRQGAGAGSGQPAQPEGR
jgi:pimeloyl-ACP methyl ester carboxylesterase